MEMNSTPQKEGVTIGLSGLLEHHNFGDGVIGNCVEWLLQSNRYNCHVAKIDMTKLYTFYHLEYSIKLSIRSLYSKV
jgi:hypothetical protein